MNAFLEWMLVWYHHLGLFLISFILTIWFACFEEKIVNEFFHTSIVVFIILEVLFWAIILLSI